MTDFVVATAGHVDHGKSTLIQALTGMQPDRWDEERRRGLTIDLGFAWMTLPSGARVAFVDVPGHQRFLANTLAGLGPAPVVCFVVAADEGWQEQSGDHRDALSALGVQHGLIVITRSDRADADQTAAVLAQTRTELAGTELRDAPAVVVSAVEGTGLDTLRSSLDRVLAELPAASTSDRVRLWVDRSFTIAGAGTVLTGTLAAGTITPTDRLHLLGRDTVRPVTMRRLHSRDQEQPVLRPTVRAALNLRGVPADSVTRGDVLLTPDAWPITDVLDVRRCTGPALDEAGTQLVVHVGTAAVPARLRPFDHDHARLTLSRRLPLVLGDRLVLRDPGRQVVLGGVQVLDADPPQLRRRGDGVRRRDTLRSMGGDGDPLIEVARRGAVAAVRLQQLGGVLADPPDDVSIIDRWWVHRPALRNWRDRLLAAVDDLHDHDPLAGGLTRGAALDLLALPDSGLLGPIADAAGLEQRSGRFRRPGTDDLGPAGAAISEIERRLRSAPFAAPQADDLTELGLGPRELAAAERAGRLLRLRDGVVLVPSAPALAMRQLAALPQPFTTSQARQALDTTRRIVIPLLEHLDERNWTRRLDAGHREVVS